MNIQNRLIQLEEKLTLTPDLDFSNFTDEELNELENLIIKTGENEDYSLLSDEELNRIIEQCKKAEKLILINDSINWKLLNRANLMNLT